MGSAYSGLACILGLLIFRSVAWFNYRRKLVAAGAPAAALAVLARISGMFVGSGNTLPAILVVAALALPSAAALLSTGAGVLAALSGRHMKFTIVTRAAQVQGYAFGELQKGHPLGTPR